MLFPFRNINRCRVTCPYGIPGEHWQSGKHDGVDLVSDSDPTIFSVSSGRVIRSENSGSWGEHIVIEMADGRSLVYAHMVAGSRKVQPGQTVKAGQPIGVMGNTGKVLGKTGIHLHIELQKDYYQCGKVDDITEFLGIENKVGEVKMLTDTKADLTGLQALNILVNKGIIETPDYWETAMKSVKYLDDLFIKLVGKLPSFTK